MIYFINSPCIKHVTGHFKAKHLTSVHFIPVQK